MNRRALNVLGLVILLIGLGAAAFISFTNRPSTIDSTADGSWQDGSLSLADSKRAGHDLEMYTGKLGVLTEILQRPDSVALIVAGGSTLVALACFFTAKRLR